MTSDKRPYPEGHETAQTRDMDGAILTVLRCRDHFCGYARLPKRPVTEDGYHGILTYVPVHGGITYSHTDDDGSTVYGFDCAHLDDEHDPQLRDVEWLFAECERMARAVLIAGEFEPRYLAETDTDKRAAVLDEFIAACAERAGTEPGAPHNFGTMLNMLFGKL